MGRASRMSALMVLATAAVLVATFGATVASSQTEMHLIAGYSRVTLVDVHEDGTMGPGDFIAARGPAFDETGETRLGSVYWDCMVQRALDGDGLNVCDTVLKLEDGLIMLRGLDPQGAGEAPFAVTGGTGTYSTARGDGTWTDVQTDTGWVTDIVIHLAA